jgi:hypothetical protein
MSSQEELVDGLRQLTEALASHHARRLSIVRTADASRHRHAEGASSASPEGVRSGAEAPAPGTPEAEPEQ